MELLQSAANWNFASGQKMTIKGTVCGNVANASSIQGNGNYSNTGFVGGVQWVGPTGPIHSTYTSQSFGCQWFTVLPPECPSPPNEPSDQLFVDIATASNTAKALMPTQTYAGIDTSGGDVTINVVSGLNVINIPPNPYGTNEGKLQVRGTGNLIINGPADAVVIFNVGADNEINAVRNGMSVENGRSILTTGGVEPQNILFNVIGGDLLINGGTIDGNFLVRAGSDVKGKATILGTTKINGIVIGDGIHSSEFLLDINASICPLATTASIDVEKEVSADNGVTWFDADIPPGQNVLTGTNPQFRFTVTNTGSTTLTNVIVTDDVFPGIIIGPISLAPGDMQQAVVIGVWASGEHVNIATATGTSDDQTVSDTDPAYWVGVVASIEVKKEVSPDNGLTWFDADAPTGPYVSSINNPIFRFTVTNNGVVTLTNVVVIDSVYPDIIIGPIPSLPPSASEQAIIMGVWASGQNLNIATATGDFGGQVYTDSDPAFWFGAVPAIDVEKEVSPDNGETWFDADNPPGPDVVAGTNPQFRFTVTNTGNVALSLVSVTDDVLGPISIGGFLDPGSSTQMIVSGAWVVGQQVNTATATGDFEGLTVTDFDPAYWFGVSGASIVIQKLVSIDSGVTWIDVETPPGPLLPPGVNPMFRFVVTNNGNVPLTNIQVTDDILGLIGTLPTINPGISFQWTITG
jgi:uncharacterized repeat protein (TIGR01451 family)